MGGHKEEASKTYIHQQKTQLLVLQKKHRSARPKAGQLAFQDYEPFLYTEAYIPAKVVVENYKIYP